MSHSRLTVIISLDVESLYTNTDHQVGVAVVMYFLDQQDNSNRMHDSLIIDLLNFVLRHNYFTFDKRFYKQVSIAMGARCLSRMVGMYTCSACGQHVIQWHRYIDDILFFWSGTHEQCQEFVGVLNHNAWNIPLMANFSTSTALDLTGRSRKRGYPRRVISKAFKKAKNTDRA